VAEPTAVHEAGAEQEIPSRRTAVEAKPMVVCHVRPVRVSARDWLDPPTVASTPIATQPPVVGQETAVSDAFGAPAGVGRSWLVQCPLESR
jgi:hypothetical protein